MFRKLCFTIVGFFCTGLFIAQAATQQTAVTPPAQQPASSLSQEASQISQDKFNFVIANPNTVDPRRFIFEIRPGEKAEDYVLVKNDSSIPLKFSLYGADQTKTAQGTFALKTKNQPAVEMGKWVTFDDREITLQPGETRKEKFIVAVPAGTPEGLYSGGVAAEKTKADVNNPNITIAVRIALRVDVKVTANPQPVEKKYVSFADTQLFQVYFWASLVLFAIFAGALAWSYFKEKKPKKHRHK